MTIVTTTEAQTMLARLIAHVAQGEDVLITEDGLPVAQLVRPNLQRPSFPATPTPSSEIEAEEDADRPWRGVFAIDRPGDPYPCGKLRLSAEPQSSLQEPVDILWDRAAHNDE